MKTALFTLATILLLTSCSKSTKKTLGLTEDMPDEFQVQRVKPLEVPPHFTHSAPLDKTTKAKKASSVPLSKAEEAALEEAKD